MSSHKSDSSDPMLWSFKCSWGKLEHLSGQLGGLWCVTGVQVKSAVHRLSACPWLPTCGSAAVPVGGGVYQLCTWPLVRASCWSVALPVCPPTFSHLSACLEGSASLSPPVIVPARGFRCIFSPDIFVILSDCSPSGPSGFPAERCLDRCWITRAPQTHHSYKRKEGVRGAACHWWRRKLVKQWNMRHGRNENMQIKQHRGKPRWQNERM